MAPYITEAPAAAPIMDNSVLRSTDPLLSALI